MAPFDLAADSSQFWWNQGSTESPIWVWDDSLLAGIRFGYDFFFIDYDGDGDWDTSVDVAPYFDAYYYLNHGDNFRPVWIRMDSLLSGKLGWFFYGPIGQAANFLHLDADGLLDLIIITFVPADPGFFLELSLFLNKGSPFEPQWDKYNGLVTGWFSLQSVGPPAYSLINYDGNDLFDIVKTDWQRHINIHLNQGTKDSAAFSYDPNLVLGSVNVESRARPGFRDLNQDGFLDLLVTEDFLTDFAFNFFHEGRVRVFENQNGYFDPGFELKKNIPQPFYKGYPIFKKALTFSFTDVDKDGDMDYLVGFLNTNEQDENIGSGLLYFQNIGTSTQPIWQPDTSRFTYFLQADSMFYAPQLIDIDHDGDLDLFIQYQGRYTFYERVNTAEENWLENRAWLTGLQLSEHYSAVFADLTHDGLEDLVFGESDGTLTFCENAGTSTQPVWQRVEEAFAGIDVGALAAPAFADLDGDGRLDLVVGNADGWLFYFRNESTVEVSTKTDPEPASFQLFQNYPNPLNPETTIEYELTRPRHVRLTIYNLLGQRVRRLVDEWQPAGRYRVKWDGSEEGGARSAASGVYVVELKLGENVIRRKMILIR